MDRCVGRWMKRQKLIIVKRDRKTAIDRLIEIIERWIEGDRKTDINGDDGKTSGWTGRK